MAKLKNPLFALSAFGQISAALVARRRGRRTVLEAKPYPKDAKTSAQLAWRTMYQLAITLWHALPAAEKKAWESVATPHHMTGYAYFLSQALRPNPGIYLPLAGGTMTGPINMGSQKITTLPAPLTDAEPSRKIDLASHLASDIHTQPQTPATHGNASHTSAFITLADIPATSTKGSYAGNNTNNRAIPHGLGATPSIVLITYRFGSYFYRIITLWNYIYYLAPAAGGALPVTALNSTNFYVGNPASYTNSANATGSDYGWQAIR
jgi:hypothetical protein